MTILKKKKKNITKKNDALNNPDLDEYFVREDKKEDENEFIENKNELIENEKVFAENENESINENEKLLENQKDDIKSMKRIKRKKLSGEDAKKIWNAYITKGPAFAKEFTYSLGYHKTTYYKVIECRGQINEKWHHPSHSKKWDDKELDTAISWIEENPVLTLNEIINKGLEEGFPFIQASTLSKYLNGRLITLKKVRINPIARNSIETKKQRIEYCSKFLDNSRKTFVFIDEMGMSICTLRNKGRSKKGTQAILKAPLSKAPNISVCMAICKEQGIVHYETKNEAFDGQSFYEFLKNLIQVCKDKNFKNIVFVMDNCKIHKKDEFNCEDLCIKNNIELWFLPPYSPELNPIENVFSMVKSNIRKLLATTYHKQLMETSNLPWGQKGKKREELLIIILDEVVELITPEIMINYWDHLMKVIPKVFKNQDI